MTADELTDSEVWQGLKQVRQQRGQENRAAALSDWQQAKALADAHGIDFRQCNESHYQLRIGNWILNVYPGNQRLYSQGSGSRYLLLPRPWTILNVVEAAIEEMEKGKR